MTTEEIRRERVRQLLSLPQLSPAPQVTGGMPEDPRLVEAARLEAEAAPIQPRGVKENIIAGLQDFSSNVFNPKGMAQTAALRRQEEVQRQQGLLERAKEMRGESVAADTRIKNQAHLNFQEDLATKKFESDDMLNRAQAIKAVQPPQSAPKGFGSSALGIYNQDTGEVTTPAPPKAETTGSLSPKDVVFTDGKRGFANFNSKTGVWTDPQGNDISAKVKHEYNQPPASVTLRAEGQSAVDAYVQKLSTGEIKSYNEVPFNIRNDVVKATAERGVRVAPPSVRERVVNVAQARELLKPIENLMQQINATSDLTQKAEMSYMLDNYAQSVGTMLSRSLGERGVATDKDVSRATGLVPGWKASNFAPEFAKKELDLLKSAITAQESSLGAYFKELGSSAAPPKAGSNRIRVRNKATGQTGTISEGAFNPAKYERIQ